MGTQNHEYEPKNYPPKHVDIVFYNCQTPSNGIKVCTMPNSIAMIQDVKSTVVTGHRRWHEETGTPMCETRFDVLPLTIGGHV